MTRFPVAVLAGLVLVAIVCMTGINALAQDADAGEGEMQLLRDQVDQYRLEAEKWRLEFETLRLEHELLRIELEKCRGGMAPSESRGNATGEAVDPGAPYVAAALAACDLAWADALLSERAFSCAQVTLEIPAQVELSITSAGRDDGADGCLVRASSQEWNATSESVWTP